MNRKTLSLPVLYFTIAGVMMGFSIIIPIVPFMVTGFGASGRALGLLITTYAVMQFLFAPVWGVLSDKYGRKPILIVGIIGNALSHLLFGLSTQLWMLYVARGLAGMLSSATLPTAMAYIGDVTSEENRGGGMGRLAAAIGFGMIIGPGIGGWTGKISLSMPFFVASGISAAALLPVLFLLPESLTEDRRKDRSVGSVTGNFRSMWKALSGPLAFPLVIAFLLDFSLMIFEGVFGLFALEQYGYGTSDVGNVLVMGGIIAVIMQGVLSGPLTKRFGEGAIIRYSMLCTAIGFPVMLFAKTTAWVMITVGFFIISNSLLRPSVSSYISKRAPGGQGEAMGLNNSFMGLGRIIGPMLGGIFYDMNFSLPYISGALILVLGFLGSLIWLKDR